MKRDDDHSSSYKGKQFIGDYIRGLVHDRRGGKHGGVQADMVLEKY